MNTRDRIAKRISNDIRGSYLTADECQTIADVVLDELGWEDAPEVTPYGASKVPGEPTVMLECAGPPDIEHGTYRLIRED